MHAVLYMMPRLPASEIPTIDRITRQVAWAIENHIGEAVFDKQCDAEVLLFNNAEINIDSDTNGFHACACEKACSSTHDYILPGGTTVTNTLAVHYLALHRNEVPAEVLDFLEQEAERHDWLEIDVTEGHLYGFCFLS